MRKTSLPAVVAVAAAASLAVLPTAGAISPSHHPRLVGTGSAAGAPARTTVEQRATAVATALPTNPDVYGRIAGMTRYQTAVEVSRAMVCDATDSNCTGLGSAAHRVTMVFVASGENFPDALGAGPVASGLGPLLLVPATGTVPAVVLDELDRIKPDGVTIIGGTGAVSTTVENQLKAHTTLQKVQRVSGTNRYDTAARAATLNDTLWRQNDANDDGSPDNHGLDTIILASGEGFADALGGGGAAANSRGALLLTKNGALPTETKDALVALAVPKVIIAGGTGVISTAVEAEVRAAVPATTVVRAAGTDRSDTAAKISAQVFPNGAPEVFVVNGYNFPDALGSAPLAGYWGATTLLAKPACVSAATRTEADRVSPTYVTGIGGPAVLGDNAILLHTC